MAKAAAATDPEVDRYLAKLDDADRAALEQLRATIHAALPGADECISYKMPALRYEGRVVVWFAAQSKHLAFYPGAEPIRKHAAELAGFGTSTGTIRFTPSKPLPASLIRKLVKAAVAARAR